MQSFDEMVESFYRSARAIAKASRRAEARSGLGPSQIAVLGYLEHGGPLSIADLASLECVSHPTMSRLVSGLERAGLIEKAASKFDARSRLVEVTPSGKQRRSDAILVRRNLVETLARRLKPDTLAELVGALEQMIGEEAPRLV